MKGLKGLRFGLLAAAAVVMAIGAGLLVSQVSAAEGVSIGSATAAPGAEATVDLEALGMADPGLGAWTIDITYDSDVVSVTDCTAGGVNSVCNEEFGDETIRVTGASAMGVEGDSVLSSITFECGDDEGSSTLALSVAVLADATIGDPQDIDASVSNGSITCAVPAPTSTAVPPGPTATEEGGAGGLPPTGAGSSGSGSGLGWLIAVLAVTGLAAMAGFGALRLRAHRS